MVQVAQGVAHGDGDGLDVSHAGHGVALALDIALEHGPVGDGRIVGDAGIADHHPLVQPGHQGTPLGEALHPPAIDLEPEGRHAAPDGGKIVLLAGGDADDLRLQVGAQVQDLRRGQALRLIAEGVEGVEQGHQQGGGRSQARSSGRVALHGHGDAGRRAHVCHGSAGQVQPLAQGHLFQRPVLFADSQVGGYDDDAAIVAGFNGGGGRDVDGGVQRQPATLEQVERVHVQRAARQIDAHGYRRRDLHGELLCLVGSYSSG